MGENIYQELMDKLISHANDLWFIYIGLVKKNLKQNLQAELNILEANTESDHLKESIKTIEENSLKATPIDIEVLFQIFK